MADDKVAANGHALAPDSPYRAKEPTENERLLAEMREMTENVTFLSRTWFNSIVDRRRDIYEECGYPSDPLIFGPGALTSDLYRALYDREPVATRVVELMPKECWQVQPLVYEDEDADDITPFEEAFDLLGQQLQPEASWHQQEAGSRVWDYLTRVDILSGIGGFGVLLLGIDDGKNFQEPVDGVMAMVTNARGEQVPMPDSPIHKDEEAALNELIGKDGTRDIPNPFKPGDSVTVNVRQLNESERAALDSWVKEREVRNARRDVDPTLREPSGYQNSPANESQAVRSAPRRQGFKADTKDPSVGPARTADGRVIAGGDGPFGTDRQYDDQGYGIGMPPPQAMSSGGSASGDQYGSFSGSDRGEQDQLASAMGPQGGAGGGLGYSLSGTDQQYFGVIMGPSEQPVAPDPQKPRPRLVLLRAYSEDLVQIVRYEWNIRNPRFGLPVMYRITLNDPREVHSGIGLPLATIFVHWTRVIHVADNLRSSEIFGVPRMRPVLNPILDIQKIRGASAEGYWQSCFTGLQFQTHPQLGGDVVVDKEQVNEAAERYRNKLQRSLIGIGGGWSTVAPSVVDPTPFIDVQKKAVCNQLGCPIRVFDGSERGELASSTDDENWDQRKRERQVNYLTPRVIVPFIDRLIQIGVLPEPGQQSKSGAKQKVENLRHVFGRRWFVQNVRRVTGGWMVRNEFKKKVQGKLWGMSREQVLNVLLPVDNATPNDPSQRKPPNLGTGGDPWQTVDAGGNETTASPSSLQGATKQVQAAFTFIPEGGYSVEWPPVDATSAADKAAIAVQYTQALSAYVQGGCEQVMPFKEYLVHVWKWEEEQAEAVIEATQQAHEDDATLSVPPNISGQPKEAAEGTQAAADKQDQKDQAKQMADAKAKQPMMAPGGGKGGAGLPPMGQKPSPNKQDMKIQAQAKAQAKASDET